MWHRPDNRGTELRRRLQIATARPTRNSGDDCNRSTEPRTQKKADQIGQPKLFVKNLFLVSVQRSSAGHHVDLSLDLFKHCIVLFERSKLFWSPFSLGSNCVEMLGS